MTEEELLATIGNNLCHTLVDYFCTKLAPGADPTVIEDQVTPLIGELSKIVLLMCTNAVVRDRQKLLLDYTNQVKQPVVVSLPNYVHQKP